MSTGSVETVRFEVAVSRPDPLRSLPTVSLAELNEAAALQSRTDRKYVLRQADLATLVDGLGGGVRVLEIDGLRRFGYESTYFDTPSLGSYLDAAHSRPNRFKVRTRTYVDSDAHHLEIKTRSRGRQTVKTRRATTTASHDRLSPDDRTFVASTLRRELTSRSAVDLLNTIDALRPVLRTHYLRATLLTPARPSTGGSAAAAPSRATIDTSLAFTTPAGTTHSTNDLVIVETKTPGRPSPIDRLLWRAGHRPVKVSKYGTGLAVAFPQLPATKWNQVLRRYFGWRPGGEVTSGQRGTGERAR